MDELGMPREAFDLLWMDSSQTLEDPAWEGYSFDFVALRVASTWAEVPESFDWPTLFWFGWPDNPRAVVAQLWRQRIFWRDTSVYIEALWHPDRGERISLRGLERDHTARDRERAIAGMQLLRRGPKRGKPVGAGRITRQEFEAKYYGAPVELRRRGLRLTQENVATYVMNIDRSTLIDYLNLYELPWPIQDRRN